VKTTCYAKAAQIRAIRHKMMEVMTEECSKCDLKELVQKFIPEMISTAVSDSILHCTVQCALVLAL
jgi:small subunit ribosomal protein S3Ae